MIEQLRNPGRQRGRTDQEPHRAVWRTAARTKHSERNHVKSATRTICTIARAHNNKKEKRASVHATQRSQSNRLRARQSQPSLQNGMMSSHQQSHHQSQSQGSKWSQRSRWNDPTDGTTYSTKSTRSRPQHWPRPEYQEGAVYSLESRRSQPSHWPRPEYQGKSREAQGHYHQDVHGMSSSQ